MFRDQRGIAVKESLTLRGQLIELMRQLDEGKITGIIYGLPDFPLHKQLYEQLLLRRDLYKPTYHVRSVLQDMPDYGLMFPQDAVGRTDAIDEFVTLASLRKVRRDRWHGEVMPRVLFVQKTIPMRRFVWAV